MIEAEAHSAMRDGDVPLARSLFMQSLRLQQSVDNLPGIATASINLATVYHRLHDDDMALRLLDAIAGDDQVPYPPDMRAEAAFRKAVILVDKNSAEAATAVAAAAARCGTSCRFAAGLNNLRARMALRKGDFPAALAAAKAAEGAAGDDKQELANARRNRAAAEAGQGRQDNALADYLAALALDKELAQPSHIAEDLAGVSGVLKQLGRNAESAAYARRAAAVRDAITPRQ